jgi:hypothetical protein
MLVSTRLLQIVMSFKASRILRHEPGILELRAHLNLLCIYDRL